MDINNQRLLVTGAAGFIGSHLCEALLERGAEVIGVDCLTDYYPPDIKRANLRSFLENPKFQFQEKNITEMDLDDLLSDLDGVFHMAAQAGVRASWGKEFDEYINQNIRATQVLLEAIKNNNPECPMILASSSSVYGAPDSLPMSEDMRTVPYSPYGVTKLAAENLGMLYSENFGLPVVAHRFFTVFGPRQRPDMAFSRFLTWVYRGETITVFGDGEQSRDFSYVTDVVRALIQSYESESFGEIYNVGGGNRVTINETLRSIEEITGKTVRTTQEPMPEGDVPHTDADVSKIRSDLDWVPEVDLDEGLSNQWDWIVENPMVRESIPAPDEG